MWGALQLPAYASTLAIVRAVADRYREHTTPVVHGVAFGIAHPFPEFHSEIHLHLWAICHTGLLRATHWPFRGDILGCSCTTANPGFCYPIITCTRDDGSSKDNLLHCSQSPSNPRSHRRPHIFRLFPVPRSAPTPLDRVPTRPIHSL